MLNIRWCAVNANVTEVVIVPAFTSVVKPFFSAIHRQERPDANKVLIGISHSLA